MRLLKTMCCAIALTAFLAPGARADEWNKLTYLTFSGPVQLPGVTLPAGTYTFKLADALGNRHIVQVFDKDQTQIFGTFMTVSDQRLEPAPKPLVMFAEAPAGQPAAVKAWFYPGNTTGDEFVYSKNQAVSIAKANHQPVMAVAEDTASTSDASAMKSTKVGHVDENGKMTEDKEDNRATTESATSSSESASTNTQSGLYTGAPAPGDHPTGVAENSDALNRYDRGRTASAPWPGGSTLTQGAGVPSSSDAKTSSAATTNQPAATAGTTARRETAVGTSGQAANNPSNQNARRLPKTASPLELMELLSGLSLAGALGIRQLRKRTSEAN